MIGLNRVGPARSHLQLTGFHHVLTCFSYSCPFPKKKLGEFGFINFTRFVHDHRAWVQMDGGRVEFVD